MWNLVSSVSKIERVIDYESLVHGPGRFLRSPCRTGEVTTDRIGVETNSSHRSFTPEEGGLGWKDEPKLESFPFGDGEKTSSSAVVNREERKGVREDKYHDGERPRKTKTNQEDD